MSSVESIKTVIELIITGLQILAVFWITLITLWIIWPLTKRFVSFMKTSLGTFMKRLII